MGPKKRSSSLSDVEDESLSLEGLAGGAGSGWVAKAANSWSRSIAREKASATNGDKVGKHREGEMGKSKVGQKPSSANSTTYI